MLKSSVRRYGLAGCVLSLCIALLTGCFLLPNRRPIASIIVHYNVTDDVMVVDLDGGTSSDPDDDHITSYMWTFGDDVDIVSSLTYSKMMAIPVTRVRYPSEGTYIVELVVIDARGAASAPVAQTLILPSIVVDPTQ